MRFSLLDFATGKYYPKLDATESGYVDCAVVGPQQYPHPWHSRAGGGAVHSIRSRHRRMASLRHIGHAEAKRAP